MINFNNIRSKKTTQIDKLNSTVIPYFNNLEQEVINYIDRSTYVIGCVAWLTNPNILSALEKKSGVKIIINKEEYLSSKMSLSKKPYYKNITNKYREISSLHDVISTCRNIFPDEIVNEINLEKRDAGILTCGIVNNFSKMHHKFLVFFDADWSIIGTWTGSYNMSITSNYSLENAIFISDKTVAKEYINEFVTVYMCSEHYDWKSGNLNKKN